MIKLLSRADFVAISFARFEMVHQLKCCCFCCCCCCWGNVINIFYLQVDIPSEPEDDEEDPDGRFGFKRKLGVKYLAVSSFISTKVVSISQLNLKLNFLILP